MQNHKIRVLIVDDHLVVRNGLSFTLRIFDDLELVGEASNGEKAIEECSKVHPDVILMDMIMPEMNGLEATRQILEQYPSTKVLILTSFEEDTMVADALNAGAIGYLLKNCSADELVGAIRNAHAGRPTLSWEATQALVKSQQHPTKIEFNLTERELEVLTLLAEGLTNRQIAEQVSLSPNTINAHVRNILSKLNVATRTEAVSVAIHNQLISQGK